MKQGFRDALRVLEDAGELRRIKKAVDPRHLSALAAQAKEATFFEAIEGYPSWRAAGALVSTRKRLALAMGCSEADIARRFEDGIRRPVDARLVSDGPCQEVVWQGDAVDLTAIPLPLMHVKDGGPYISATMVVSKDPEYGRNVGSYRLMYRTPRETGIDLVSSSDMRRYYQRALDAGRPLEIAVAVGVHPYEMLAASYKAPIDVDEYAIAGGLHGAPVDLVRCRTVDLEVPADAELVLEGELLPIGWTADEGPFGEFSHITGDVKWNPIFRVKCITHRRDPIFYMLQMPWENAWLGAAATEAQVWNVLKTAGVDVVNVAVTEGSACRWSVIASIRKRAGGGKNALMAILALPDTKHAIVVDEDVDIHDPTQVEWARTFRVQADKDVIIIAGAQAKHVDPSVRPWELEHGELPMTAKMGIDATIPEGIAPAYYDRIRHVWVDDVRLEDYQ